MSCLQRVGGEALAAVWLLDCQSIASLNYHLRRHKCCLSNHEARGAQCRCTHHTAVCTLQYCTVPTGLTGSVEEMDSRGSNTSLGLNQRNRSEDSPGLRDSPPAQQNFRPIFRCHEVRITLNERNILNPNNTSITLLYSQLCISHSRFGPAHMDASN